jgi:hypothetical protein
VQTKGLVGAAGLLVLDFQPKEPEEVWQEENIHKKQAGLCLASAASSKGGHAVLASSSTKTDLRVYSSRGRWAAGSGLWRRLVGAVCSGAQLEQSSDVPSNGVQT